jgi:hypothetical protein
MISLGRKTVLTLCMLLLLGSVLFAPKSALAAGQCYAGSYKGTIYENGSWHHYVEFLVNYSTSDANWYIQSKPWGFPFGASLWPGYYRYHHGGSGPAVYKELGYNWPYNWPAPYSASSWVICHR